MRKFIAALITLSAIVALGTLKAQDTPPRVTTRLTPDTIMIGDQLHLQIDIDKDVAQEIQLPQFDKNKMTEQIEVVGIPTVDTLERDARQVKLRINYTLTSFDQGTHDIQGFPIVYSNGEATDTVFSSQRLRLVVRTFEIDTTKQQIVDIKSPIETPLLFAEIKDYVIYGSLAAILLAGIIYLIVRYVAKRKGHVRQRPDEPPHITAIRLLEKLQSEKLWQNGNAKEYYSRLTDILRLYMQGRYAVWAMEMTTPEIITAMSEHNSDKLISKLKELFTLADLVKFAKWTPSPEENEQAYYTAYYYVEETKILNIETQKSDEQ